MGAQVDAEDQETLDRISAAAGSRSVVVVLLPKDPRNPSLIGMNLGRGGHRSEGAHRRVLGLLEIARDAVTTARDIVLSRVTLPPSQTVLNPDDAPDADD